MRILLAFCFVGGALAASAQQEGIAIKKEAGKSIVEFKGVGGKVLKRLDVEASNPYKAALARAVSSGGHTFSEGLVSESGSSGVAVVYRWVVYSDSHEQLQDQGESMVIVYNLKGTEVFRKAIAADNGHDPLMSINGKYVGVSFSGLVHDAPTRKSGFAIYNVDTKATVFETEVHDIAGAVQYDDMFVFSVPEGDAEKSITFYVFDTRTAQLYSKKYPLSVYPYIKRFDNDGAVFLLPPDAERSESYNKHFSLIKK